MFGIKNALKGFNSKKDDKTTELKKVTQISRGYDFDFTSHPDWDKTVSKEQFNKVLNPNSETHFSPSKTSTHTLLQRRAFS
jgi:hypothetical protein